MSLSNCHKLPYVPDENAVIYLEAVPPTLGNRIPILKEFFSSRSRLNERTDIVISITPRIIRMPEIGRDDLEAWLIGTRDQVRMEKWKSYQGEKGK